MTHEYDAIIVGAGGAGLYAALEASSVARTAVISKLHPMRSCVRRPACTLSGT